jgi:histidine triad (HIT) family protein
MENPLSEDQIIELNEIVKLPKDAQQKKLSSFLSKLSPEQIEFLKKSQQQQCLFCSIVNWDNPQYRIYEDINFIGILDINPATRGHIIVIPKKHVKFINEVEADYSKPIKKIINKLYEVLQCDTSVVINNGELAGQKLPHASIHIIPRYENDKVNIAWTSEKINEDELKQLSQKLRVEKEMQKDIPEKLEEIKDYYEEERIA